MSVKIAIGNIETIAVWWARLMKQLHSSLLRCPATFMAIAKFTGTNYIFPGVLSTAPPWNNMV
jgi:hypothetical protein